MSHIVLDDEGDYLVADEAIRCKCFGADRRTRCEREATEEDGLCDVCRCPHGGCDKHGDEATWRNDMWYNDPMAYIDWYMRAMAEMNQCMGQQSYEKMLEEEMKGG